MGKRILVVDDDPSIAEAISLTLEDEGYTVQTLHDGKKVWDKVDLWTPDVIILDILMSGYDGREIARRLKEHQATRQIPIVISSAHPHGASMAQEAGADEFLPKPFDISRLLDVVARCAHSA
ncbi:MAG: response regulator transcription factor [Anaerolineae bacterium]|nr:response regulator transcription factor [Anaerolineae bacterium]